MTHKTNIAPELEEKIEQYVNEQLTQQQIDDLWAELIRNEEALDYLKTVATLRKIADEEDTSGLVSDQNNDSFNRVQRNWLIAAAAAVVLIVASFGIVQTILEPDVVEPIASIELDYYRSADGLAEAEDSVGEAKIREAIIMANQGEYQQALQILEEGLITVSDTSIRAMMHMNAGSILYNINQYEEAASQFEQALSIEHEDDLIQERAYWLLGNTYFQLNMREEARAAFQSAYELNGAYSRVAQSYIRALASS